MEGFAMEWKLALSPRGGLAGKNGGVEERRFVASLSSQLCSNR